MNTKKLSNLEVLKYTATRRKRMLYKDAISRIDLNTLLESSSSYKKDTAIVFKTRRINTIFSLTVKINKLVIGFSFSSDHKTWFCDKFEAFFPLIWLLKIFFKIILNYLLQLEFERVTSVRTNYYCLEIWNIYYNTLFSKQMTGYCRVKILMFFFFQKYRVSSKSR